MIRNVIKQAKKETSISGSMRVRKRKRGVIYWSKPSTLSFLLSVFAFLSIGFAVLSATVPIVPMIWYRISPGTSSALAEILARPALTFGDLLAASGEREFTQYQPAVDPSLPKEGRVRIAKIGVDTSILEESAENYEKALRKGVWRVPGFGTPFERRFPSILVAHRFGYLSWSNAYRKKNSFFNLPKLSPGDRVEIIWQQRRYVYEIYGGDETERVTDYTADLILYTCRYLESPIRIFRYAKLVAIPKT
ncbi:hypothetical protein IH980_04180 [Patescibacteria group bacterium]|nr:hypothetical protein [Patescibacteria group bacterium]